MQRPILDVERRMESGSWGREVIYPHCDARILHLPHECDYCGMCDELQEERVRLNVSNTGVANRQWPCPADRARSEKDYHTWGGNRPKKLTADEVVTLQRIQFDGGEIGVKRKDDK